MNFEGPKAGDTIYERDNVELVSFLSAKTPAELEEMVKKPYKIFDIIQDGLGQNPYSRTLNCVKMFSDREISEAAQEEIVRRNSANFFAM